MARPASQRGRFFHNKGRLQNPPKTKAPANSITTVAGAYLSKNYLLNKYVIKNQPLTLDAMASSVVPP